MTDDGSFITAIAAGWMGGGAGGEGAGDEGGGGLRAAVRRATTQMNEHRARSSLSSLLGEEWNNGGSFAGCMRASKADEWTIIHSSLQYPLGGWAKVAGGEGWQGLEGSGEKGHNADK